MLIERITCREPAESGHWPFTLPPVEQLRREGIGLTGPITFVVGENGSGKSTLVEALAEAYGLDAQGGRAGRKYGNQRPKTALGERLVLDYTPAGARLAMGPRTRKHGYFLRAETAFGLMAAVTGLPGYWSDDVTTMSHGESFLTVFDAMFAEPGLYLMDEPEAALSFASCLRLVALMRQLADGGGQIVCATHSPVLSALPGAQILEVGEHGIRDVRWDELALVEHWRRYLDDPDAYLRHLL